MVTFKGTATEVMYVKESDKEYLINITPVYNAGDGEYSNITYNSYDIIIDKSKALDFFTKLHSDSKGDIRLFYSFDTLEIDTNLSNFVEYLKNPSDDTLLPIVVSEDVKASIGGWLDSEITSIKLDIGNELYTNTDVAYYDLTIVHKDTTDLCSDTINVISTVQGSLGYILATLSKIVDTKPDIEMDVSYNRLMYKCKVKDLIDVKGNLLSLLKKAELYK